MAEFSLTSLVKRQAHNGRVFTHLPCRMADTQWSSFHSPLVPNVQQAHIDRVLLKTSYAFGPCCTSFPIFQDPPCYMTTIGIPRKQWWLG
ncbi:unnamed protein product [Prunus armeniaca]